MPMLKHAYLLALELNPDLFQVYWHLGKLYAQEEQWTNAEEMLNHYLDYNTQNAAVQHLLEERP